MVCSVEGSIDVVMIPIINNQEVYAGEKLINSPYDEPENRTE
jgi:hypothetical protein